MRTTTIRGEATARRTAIALLILLAAMVATATADVASTAPLTPEGVAPLVYRGSSHPDSLEGGVALSGSLAHRPAALAVAARAHEIARSGNSAAALDHWQEASRLDPGFTTAHLSPARYVPLAYPRRTLDALLAAPRSVAYGFLNQQNAVANVLILVFFPLLLAACGCALLIFIRHAASVHHLFWEHLQPALPRFVAKWAVWCLLILPLFWNLGMLLWAALLLAAAFPLLPRAERRFAVGVAVLFAIAPLGVKLVATLTAPASPNHVANVVWRAQQAGRSPETLKEVAKLAQRYPNESLLHFTESLLARQVGDLETARGALLRAEACGQLPDGRLAASWAVLSYREGRVEEAIRRFSEAAEADPERYDLRYNLSKAYARASLFLKADREMRRAFVLDADRVRFEEQRRLEEKVDDLVEDRLHSAEVWQLALRAGDTRAFQLPRVVGLLFPGGNPRLLWPGFLAVPAIALFARRCSQRLVIHTCSQCGRRVCRRCLKRRDRRVYCPACALTVGRWAQAQYTQVLLTKLLGRHDRLRDRLVDLARMVVPGLGAALSGHVNRAFLQLLWLVQAATWLAMGGLPLKPQPWTHLDESIAPALPLGILALIALEIWTVRSEVRGLKRKSTLKEFLSANRAGQARRKAA